MTGHRFAEVERWLDSALAIDPEFFRARTRRAIARGRLGDRAGARVDFEAARPIRGSSGWTRNRGRDDADGRV